jgi:ribosome-associated protein
MTTRTRSRRAPDRGSPFLESVVTAALDDMKAVNVKVMDVRGLTDIADIMVVASGNSDRHVRSIADRVIEKAKESGVRPLGVEGAREGEWVLVDLQDIVVHVMLPRVREFYSLERMWETEPAPAVAVAVPVSAAPRAKAAPRKRAPRRKSTS